MSTFPDLIKQRELQHSQKLRDLMAANQELLARLDREAAERTTSDQRLKALEVEVESLKDAVRHSTVSQRDVLDRMSSDIQTSGQGISQNVEALLEEHQHAMHERLLGQQLGSWEVMNKALTARAEETAAALAEVVERVEGSERMVEDCRQRVDTLEGCLDRSVQGAEHRLQLSVLSHMYLAVFEDIGDRMLSEMMFQHSWLSAGQPLLRQWDYRVNTALHGLERAQEHIRSTYPEMGDQRVDLMVQEMSRAAESLEHIVGVNARRAAGVGGGDNPEVARRIKALEDALERVTASVDSLRRPAPSAWRQDVPLEVESPAPPPQPPLSREEQYRLQQLQAPPAPSFARDGSPRLAFPSSVHVMPPLAIQSMPGKSLGPSAGGPLRAVPDTTRSPPHYAPSVDSANTRSLSGRGGDGGGLEARVNAALRRESRGDHASAHEGTGEWRHALLLDLQARLGLKDAPWEEILMIDAASSIERLYARAEELGHRREERESELDTVNAMLGHIQSEFLRLTEREAELGDLPNTAEWKETLVMDSSKDAEGLRQHLAQLQDNITVAKQSVYSRERTLIEKRNDLWRLLSDINEDVGHVAKQVEYYQDVLGTEQILTTRLASGQ